MNFPELTGVDSQKFGKIPGKMFLAWLFFLMSLYGNIISFHNGKTSLLPGMLLTADVIDTRVDKSLIFLCKRG